ncbi:MAG: histidine phosphatase family protein [Candidatus Saccharimonas sp.]
MPKPENIVLIRHGQSETNLLHKNDLAGAPFPEEIRSEILSRPDWQHRLTRTGVRQSLLAGEAIRLLYGDGYYFDARYVSPFIRTRETAGLLFQRQPECNELRWMPNIDLTERSWGLDSQLTYDQRQERYPDHLDLLRRTPWFARYNNGESALDVVARTQHFMQHIEQTSDARNVVAVTHEGPMSALRYLVEGMLPEEWESLTVSGSMAIRNGTLLQYSRVNPNDARDTRPEFSWRRMVYSDKSLDQSPDEGKLIEFEPLRNHLGAELLRQVNDVPCILD